MSGEPTASPAGQPSRLETIAGWVVTAALLGGLVLFLVSSHPPRMAQPASPANMLGGVQIAPPRQLLIAPDAPLMSKLTVRTVHTEPTEEPLLEVPGSVMASLARGGSTSADMRWQFASPELLSAYVEWTKSGSEMTFARQQLATTRALHQTRVSAQTRVVERMRKLVEAGSDAPRDLALEETNLVQARLEGQRQIHESEMLVRNTERVQASLERQLQQAGVDPLLMRSTRPGSVLLVADVPESKIDRVHEGQGCTARFYGVPGVVFRSQVSRISPTLTREQRTLRVLTVLDDTDGKLRPGMFADVGLGTDARQAVRLPTDGVLHLGRADYVLVRTGPGEWAIREVALGETRGTEIEVLTGVKAGDEVLGAGAILLKPVVDEALRQERAAR